jgi:hypothetical protein
LSLEKGPPVFDKARSPVGLRRAPGGPKENFKKKEERKKKGRKGKERK